MSDLHILHLLYPLTVATGSKVIELLHLLRPQACPSPIFGALLWASGVEVYGCEWFFGASAEGLFHGVNCNEAKQHAQHSYRTSAPWMDWATDVFVAPLAASLSLMAVRDNGSLQPSIPECSKDR